MTMRLAKYSIAAGVVCLTLIAAGAKAAQAQEREPISLLLSDPGRMPEGGQVVARADSVTRKILAANQQPPKPQWFVLPSQGFSTSSTFAGQLRMRSLDVVEVGGHQGGFTAYGSYARVDQHTAVRDRFQLGGSLDFKPFTTGTEGAVLTLTGLYSNTSSVVKDVKGAAELDVPLANSTLGGVVYYDEITPSGASKKTGWTPGIVGTWTPREGTQFAAEYDFNTNIAGEDAFVAKLGQAIGTWSSHAVAFTVGAGKHRVITTALKIALN